jgi:hypothetical protein
VKVDQLGEGPSNEQIDGENTISNLRMTYQLEEQLQNYDQDAVDNRVSKQFTLYSFRLKHTNWKVPKFHSMKTIWPQIISLEM